MADTCALPGGRLRSPVSIVLLGALLSGPLTTEARAAALMSQGSHVSTDRVFRFKKTERCFMRRTNRVRERHGLRRLRWDKHIGYVARRHARRLARHGVLEHDDALARRVTHWRLLGQNTGRGRNCWGLFRAFLESKVHRANILGPWRFIGVGARRRDGELFVQQVFEAHSNPGNIYGFP
jgi:uncharacterized protein YkwD